MIIWQDHICPRSAKIAVAFTSLQDISLERQISFQSISLHLITDHMGAANTISWISEYFENVLYTIIVVVKSFSSERARTISQTTPINLMLHQI